MAEKLENATKIIIKRGERKRKLPPASPPVGEEEREAGEVAEREREKERERCLVEMEEGSHAKKKEK